MQKPNKYIHRSEEEADSIQSVSQKLGKKENNTISKLLKKRYK